MSDDWTDEPPADHDDHGAGRASRSWTDPAAAPSLLRAAALVATVLWVIGLVSSLWFQLSQLDGASPFGGQPGPSRLLGAVASSFTATWGYLLVAVIALTAATIVGRPATPTAGRSPT